MRHNKATKFFERKNKIRKRLRQMYQLELEIDYMRKAQRKLVEDYPELVDYINSEDFI